MKKRMNNFKKGLIVAGIAVGAAAGGKVVDKLDNPYDMVPNNDEVATLDTISDSKLEATGVIQEQLNKYNEYKEILDNPDITEEELAKLPKEIYKLGLDIFKSKVAENTGVSKDEIEIDVSHNPAGKREIKIEILDKEYKYFEDKGFEGRYRDSGLSDKIASYAASMAKIDTIQDKQRNEMKVSKKEMTTESKNALKSIGDIMPDMIEVNENSITTKTMPKTIPLYETEFKKISDDKNKDYKVNIEQVLEDEEEER